MKRKILRTLTTLLLAPLAPTTRAAEALPPPVGKPNIAFLLADDLRPDCLGVLGHPIVKTQNPFPQVVPPAPRRHSHKSVFLSVMKELCRVLLLLQVAASQPLLAAASGLEGAPGTLTLANFHDALVPKGFVLSEKDWHIWCNAPILDGQGKVHLFVSRWPVKDTFALGWHTSCEIAHYKADQPVGPYTFVSTVLKGSGVEGSWRKCGTHNVTVVHLPDQRYAMLFIANSTGTGRFVGTQKIGLMLASSLEGPWTFAGQDGLILDVPSDPAVWSHGSVVGVNNPTLLPMPDGRFLLCYKAMQPGKGAVRRMGVAVADKVEGPYRFAKDALTANEGTIEDGFAFLLNGEACLLVTDCHGPGSGGGMIYHSQDGLHFAPAPIRAYEAVDHYMKRWPQPANGWGPWVLQRPALLLGADGTPTHLFAPCGTPPEGKKGTSTFLFAIKPDHKDALAKPTPDTKK